MKKEYTKPIFENNTEDEDIQADGIVAVIGAIWDAAGVINVALGVNLAVVVNAYAWVNKS